ncbi:hypothetical protein PCI56_08140 [Plesiomonas shigelloides subsp. oncorhynchi]|nr:hypothetical protein [Plesiomonas shigelloides]
MGVVGGGKNIHQIDAGQLVNQVRKLSNEYTVISRYTLPCMFSIPMIISSSFSGSSTSSTVSSILESKRDFTAWDIETSFLHIIIPLVGRFIYQSKNIGLIHENNEDSISPAYRWCQLHI